MKPHNSSIGTTISSSTVQWPSSKRLITLSRSTRAVLVLNIPERPQPRLRTPRRSNLQIFQHHRSPKCLFYSVPSKQEGDFNTARNLTPFGPTIVKCLSYAKTLSHSAFLPQLLLHKPSESALETEIDAQHALNLNSTSSLEWNGDEFRGSSKSDEGQDC